MPSRPISPQCAGCPLFTRCFPDATPPAPPCPQVPAPACAPAAQAQEARDE
jgi:hypothetical protein